MSSVGPGDLVDNRYRVVKLLGEGGMGSVFEAVHEAINRRVALKVMHPRLVTDEQVVGRFQREAQAVNAIGHKHIVEATDFGRLPGGEPYMVLELLQGHDYREELDRQGAQPIRKTAQLIQQVCAGLGAAHAAGIIHRDLKPENLYLARKDGEQLVKILDFGISKFLSNNGMPEMTKTRTGTVVGTPYYMSPEQIRSAKEIDGQSDVWSVAVVLFEMLSGVVPFHAPIPLAVLSQVLKADPAPLAKHAPHVPPAVVAVVHRGLTKAPEDRPHGMGGLMDALLDAARADGVQVKDPRVADW